MSRIEIALVQAPAMNIFALLKSKLFSGSSVQVRKNRIAASGRQFEAYADRRASAARVSPFCARSNGF